MQKPFTQKRPWSLQQSVLPQEYPYWAQGDENELLELNVANPANGMRRNSSSRCLLGCTVNTTNATATALRSPRA